MDEVKREEGVKMAAPAAVSSPLIELEQVFREHHGRVFRAAYRVTGNASDAEDVDSKRHRQKANYAFADGHSQLLPFALTYAPPQVDLWNPSLAQ